jgi:hypothetical protein
LTAGHWLARVTAGHRLVPVTACHGLVRGFALWRLQISWTRGIAEPHAMSAGDLVHRM